MSKSFKKIDSFISPVANDVSIVRLKSFQFVRTNKRKNENRNKKVM